LNGNGYESHHHNDTNDDETAETQPETLRPFQAPMPFLEFVVVSIYKCFGIGLHAGLAIAFLAIVAVSILGSFNDRYFVTILTRARRTDADLQNEITYYERKCDMTDVTTSDSHHIHFGEIDDTASEIFIDVEKIRNDLGENGGDDDDDSEFYFDDRGFRTKYQQEKRLGRRRRLFKPLITAYETPKLKPIPKTVAEAAGKLAVTTMMKHGSVMVPQILSESTIVALRDFISDKNELVSGTSDEYPMTAKHHRISYGIESTEDPAVVRALKEIREHRVFAELIQNLVGDENPALSEITAITAWAGAEDQSWHPDVKPHGNGVKFGRTYSHSYSLFLPLQDTSRDMGATELCPGTHMCASEDLSEICDSNSVDFSEVRKARPRNEYSLDVDGEQKYKKDLKLEGLWRAGDGALLNQQGWHRGTAHTDEDADDRIVFIVSFLKRPAVDDPRQLARGTYFHQRWLNWGSTWEDMVDTMANLQRPWNVLRCLHLYTPSDRSWGYDLFTATTLRVANGQMGGEPEDLDSLIDNVMIPLQFPDWLQGEIDYESEHAWQIYLTETIRKTFDFLFYANLYGHIGLVAFLAIASVLDHLYNKGTSHSHDQSSVVSPVLKTGVKRLILTHGSILAFGFYVWRVAICSSQWAIDIDSGDTLMRPFPIESIYLDDDSGVLGTNATLPRRSDVLIGTRLNTKAIGAYNTWLEYHPGNRIFDQFIEAHGGTGGFYHSLLPTNSETNQTTSGLPSGFSERLVVSAFDMIAKHHGGGRFLMQDYRFGDWLLLSEAESRDYIKRRLLIGGKHANALGAVHEEINLLLDKQRFGFPRRTLSMSWNSQLFLLDLSKEVFSTKSERDGKKIRAPDKLTTAFSPSISFTHLQLGYRLPKWEAIGPTVSGARDKDGNRMFLIGENSPSFRPGMEIYYFTEDEDSDIFAGTIVGIFDKDRFPDGHCRYHIALEEDGVAELSKVDLDSVPRSLILSRLPISSGARVMAHPEPDEGYYDGTATMVFPDGVIDVKFDDGSVGLSIDFDQYKTVDEIELARKLDNEI